VLVLVIPLALLAALLYSLSDFMQQRAASLDAHQPHPEEVRVDDRHRVLRALSSVAHTMTRLIHDRRWMVGWTIGTAALAVQAIALRLGSVAVVQTLQVTSLLFAIPLSTVYSNQRPGARDYLGGSLVCAGLVAVIAVRGGATDGPVDRRPSVFLFVLVALVMMAFVAVAVSSPGPVRVTALAAAAGVAFGCSAALVKLTTTDLTTVGVIGTARDWPGYGLAVATAAGVVIQQLAFGAGRLAAATTAMIVANPLVGYAIAVLGFGEHLPDSPGGLAGIALGGFCATIGVVLLAHSPVLFGKDDDEEYLPAKAAGGATGRLLRGTG
jgi:drug/metabolite transporter (DMT)-like permease